jgi:YD repeat-containing protein
VYEFNNDGRHLRTIDALSGVNRRVFGYDSAGRLATITDRIGQVTEIQRTSGVPSAIVAPGGQTTTLTVDGNGYLATIAQPGLPAYGFTYDSGGLMGSMTTPRGTATSTVGDFTHTFTYD